jgi:hypothetical protein
MTKVNRYRRFQFSLKGLFIAVTVIAVIFGVWALSPGERQRRAVQRVQRLGGSVKYETPELVESPFLFSELVLRACLPSDYFDPVIAVNLFDTPARDTDMQSLGTLTDIQVLALNETEVTDNGLLHLHRNKNLKLLFIGNTKITAQGIAEFKKAVPNCDVRQR